MSIRLTLRALVALSLVAASTRVLLSDDLARAENPRVNAQTFRPSPHARDLFATVTSEIPEPWSWNAALWASYALDPLVFVDIAEVAPDHGAVEHQLALHATGALAFTDWLSVGLEVPVFLVNDGDDRGFVPLDPIPGAALGDVRLSAKIGILTRARAESPGRYDDGEDGLGLGLELGLGLPTGDPDAFVSDGLSFVPAFVVDVKLGRFRAALNLGARIRGEDELAGGTEVGHEALFRVAASYRVLPDLLTVLAELHGASHDFSLSNNTYVEGLVGGRLELGSGLHLTLAGGRGFASGYGSTAARVVASLAYVADDDRPRIPPDSDGDGLRDDVDRCPRQAEDMDGFEDDDGCPDADDDGDGVLDLADACPREPEDKDGFEDDDGCPEADNDKDGIADLADGPDGACRNAPEDKDGFQDDDGCPDPDNDGDGVLDAEDDCPLDAANACGITVDPCEIKIGEMVYFAYDKAEILPESHGILDAVAALLNTRDQIMKVEVQGHTDNQGDDDYNLRLSQWRAEAVVAYLANKGVAATRLTAKGYGETRPLGDNRSATNRSKNRRVQFIIVETARGGCGRD